MKYLAWNSHTKDDMQADAKNMPQHNPSAKAVVGDGEEPFERKSELKDIPK